MCRQTISAVLAVFVVHAFGSMGCLLSRCKSLNGQRLCGQVCGSAEFQRWRIVGELKPSAKGGLDNR